MNFVLPEWAYRMLGREGENKNCLLGWVWVHQPERPQPKLVVAAGSLQPAQTQMGVELGFIYMGFLQLMVHWWVLGHTGPKGEDNNITIL
jgi:hypothetical protein